MTDPKHAVPTKLLWVDLEMTGLRPAKDVILEIAAEITDFDFKPLASYESRIAHPQEAVAELMRANPWWETVAENRDNFLQGLEGGKSLEQVEDELLALLNAQFGDEPVILAGNSVHMDRQFIDQWWPRVAAKLHYRMLDVTAWKIIMQGKYGQEFPKKETHRAFDDIHESIEELQFYLDQLASK